jgi:HPr kinase/phosphorylase
VAAAGRALLLTGPSGSGKSSLALDLISRGARLVADDGVWLRPDPDGPVVEAPRGAGRIEVRGMGLIPAPHAPRARLVAVVDLSREEEERLPPERGVTMGGAALRLLHGSRSPSFAAALHVYLLSHAE